MEKRNEDGSFSRQAESFHGSVDFSHTSFVPHIFQQVLSLLASGAQDLG